MLTAEKIEEWWTGSALRDQLLEESLEMPIEDAVEYILNRGEDGDFVQLMDEDEIRFLWRYYSYWGEYAN